MARKSPIHTNAPDAHFDRSAFTAIRAEDLGAIAQIKASLVAHYQPADSEELYAIERIALARHSMLRTYRMESGLISFDLQKALQIGGVPEIPQNPEDSYAPHVTKGQEESFWMATGFYEVNRLSPSCWEFFLRYQAQTERLYRRAMEEFERLRSHRARAPEPASVEPAPAPVAQPPEPDSQTPHQPAAEPSRQPNRTSRVILSPNASDAVQSVQTGSPNAP